MTEGSKSVNWWIGVLVGTVLWVFTPLIIGLFLSSIGCAYAHQNNNPDFMYMCQPIYRVVEGNLRETIKLNFEWWELALDMSNLTNGWGWILRKTPQ